MQVSGSGYPDAIDKIIVTKCAISGCHNTASKDASHGLDLSTWNNMMLGTRSGVCIIPYRPDQSTLMFFTNTYSEYGIALAPTMPIGAPALSKDEIKTLQNWISQGAPNKDNYVNFSDNPDRRKVYVSNQGCDLVSVFDAASSLQMRAVDVGVDPNKVESPHQIKISPDGQYWYVIFYNGNYLQKYRTADNSLVGQVLLTTAGSSSWNTLCISPDGKYVYAANWIAKGGVAVVDANTMKLKTYINDLIYPHGLAVDNKGTTLYVTAQTSNYLTKIDISDFDFPATTKVALQPGEIPTDQSSYDPHEVILSPDEAKYFVTCQTTNEVRIFKTSNDSLLKTIKVGEKPQEMAISTSTNYLFVSCMEDSVSAPPFTRGSISVIDYKNGLLAKTVYGFYQPHGVAVDDNGKTVYVANRNVASGGPAPHHTTACGGKNGYLQKINLNTLLLDEDFHSEISVDPYSVAVRK